MAMLRNILVGLLGFIALVVAAAYVLWPSTWTVNAPITNSLFGWGVEASAQTDLQKRLHLPEGYHLNIYATGLGQARIMRWTSTGDLLVSIPRKGEIALIGRDSGNSGQGGSIHTLVSGLNRPHGIEIINGYLYIAETDAIARIELDEKNGRTIGALTRIVTGLPGDGNHWARTLRLGPDGFLYLNIGSSCNACIEEDKRRAALMRVKPDGSALETFAEGLRNTTGFDWDEKGELWGVENGRDLLGDDVPPEELNHIEQGKFYGWPFRYGNNIADPELGNMADPRIANAVPAAFALPAHAAPLSIKFMRDTKLPGLAHAALVTLHGSWNRSKKQGYEIVSLYWKADGTIEMQPFLTGFSKNEDAIGRPVDTSVGPDGAIYVSDDYAGSIYRISTDTKIAADASAAVTTIATPQNEPAIARGKTIFEVSCQLCHGGKTPLVTLQGLSRYSAGDIVGILTTPPANMPIIPLEEGEKQDLAAYLLATHK